MGNEGQKVIFLLYFSLRNSQRSIPILDTIINGEVKRVQNNVTKNFELENRFPVIIKTFF